MINDEYGDIINLPHHVSAHHEQMSLLSRAAQFSPFAALTGYEDALEESTRRFEERTRLADEAADELDAVLQEIKSGLKSHPYASFTYFVKENEEEEKGHYETVKSFVRRIDETGRYIFLEDGKTIPVSDLAAAEIIKDRIRTN